jgi:hypothetical protein
MEDLKFQRMMLISNFEYLFISNLFFPIGVVHRKIQYQGNEVKDIIDNIKNMILNIETNKKQLILLKVSLALKKRR